MSKEIQNAPTLPEMERYAQAIVKSGFCGFSTPEQAITLMLVAIDEGRSVGSVARDYHVIKGRPSIKADAMLARYQEAGGTVRWKVLSDKECTAVFSHPASGEFELTWTIDQAKNAGLTTNDTWRKYPRAMLRSRVISEGIRTSFPAVICGTYTPEEAAAIAVEDEEPRRRSSRPAPETVQDVPILPEPVQAIKSDAARTDSPQSQLKKRLAAERQSDPEAYEAVRERLRENGWTKPSEVPAERIPEVSGWFDEWRQEKASMKSLTPETAPENGQAELFLGTDAEK
jgi:hypothetical protein